MIQPVQTPPNSAQGRLDVLLLRLAEHICRTHVEPALGLPVWDNGVGLFAREAVAAANLPVVEFSGEQIARMMAAGFFSPRQNRRVAPARIAVDAGVAGGIGGNAGGIR